VDGGGVRDGAPLVASVTSRTTCIEECALLSISPTTQCVSAYRPSPSDQGARSRALVRPSVHAAGHSWYSGRPGARGGDVTLECHINMAARPVRRRTVEVASSSAA